MWQEPELSIQQNVLLCNLIIGLAQSHHVFIGLALPQAT
jgi:hypothetical protein